MKKKPKVIGEKNCGCCCMTFEVYADNPQKEYCCGTCWCKANNIKDEDKCRHFLGGHKNMKRSKNDKKNKKKKKK